MAKVPVIDLDADPELEGRRVWGILRDEGYFYLTGSKVADVDLEKLVAVAEEFFRMPVSEKMKFHISGSTCHRGYYPPGEEGPADGIPDLKEGYDSGLFEIRSGRDGHTISSPGCSPPVTGFLATVNSYHSAMTDIAHTLSVVVAHAIGMPDRFFLDRSQNPPNQLRLLHYPASPTPRQGVGTHKDFECFTLLASTGPGLEVERSDGTWILVPPRQDTLVVTTGEMLEILTNGAVLAARHRVGWVREERYSFPYFFSLDRNILVEPLDRFVGPEGTHYASLTAGDHLQARTSQVFRYLRNREQGKRDRLRQQS
ncbi:2OG-Fe(II) oxygenase family protein [Streptomyces sp. NPDC007861]|uniref:isopenicillin N synthase family dioxygenase n=1 Tax=Streptomyces sp. NPDC007861 TaxID=3154893 RepID=UPI0033F689FC